MKKKKPKKIIAVWLPGYGDGQWIVKCLVLVWLLASCTPQKCGTWKDVQRHDKSKFRK